MFVYGHFKFEALFQPSFDIIRLNVNLYELLILSINIKHACNGLVLVVDPERSF